MHVLGTGGSSAALQPSNWTAWTQHYLLGLLERQKGTAHCAGQLLEGLKGLEGLKWCRLVL